MHPEALRDLYERMRRAIARRPAFAQGSDRARVRIFADLRCEISDGRWCTFVDQERDHGGAGVDPDPAQLMRASLGGSLAMGYRLWGARLSVDVREVGVEVVCDFDLRGQMGMSHDVPVAWQRVVFDVQIVSAASEADVRRVVDTSDRLNPMLACLSPAIPRLHRLQVFRPGSLHAGTERVVPPQVTPLQSNGHIAPDLQRTPNTDDEQPINKGQPR